MKKLQSSLVNMVLVLGAVSILAATLLATVNLLTAEPIRQAEAAKQENAVKEVTPAFDNSPIADKVMFTDAEGFEMACYPAKMDGRLVGVAVETASNKGFNGQIRLMVGFTPEGDIVNYSVLEQGETPGLGAKMGTWFKTDKNRQNVCGLNPGRNRMTVSKDGGEVDAITAATISSRAFLDAVNRAYASFLKIQNVSDTVAVDALSSATVSQAEGKEVQQ